MEPVRDIGSLRRSGNLRVAIAIPLETLVPAGSRERKNARGTAVGPRKGPTSMYSWLSLFRALVVPTERSVRGHRIHADLGYRKSAWTVNPGPAVDFGSELSCPPGAQRTREGIQSVPY